MQKGQRAAGKPAALWLKKNLKKIKKGVDINKKRTIIESNKRNKLIQKIRFERSQFFYTWVSTHLGRVLTIALEAGGAQKEKGHGIRMEELIC
jgi:hypothetical protein